MKFEFFREMDAQIAKWFVRRLIGGQDLMVFPRRLSKVDRERINQYVAGGYHFVRRNHGQKAKPFNPKDFKEPEEWPTYPGEDEPELNPSKMMAEIVEAQGKDEQFGNDREAAPDFYRDDLPVAEEFPDKTGKYVED